MYERHEKANPLHISPARKMLAKWLEPHKKQINKILEIGARDGVALSFLVNELDADGYGIEPSSKAINAWKNKFSHECEGANRIKLKKGVSSYLPYDEESFDLVLFGFCLYLVDRKMLFRSISEADRVLKSSKFLAIEDFDPSKIIKNDYKHHSGMFSYKQDHSQIFLASNHYALVNKYSYPENGGNKSNFYFQPDINSRVSISLLFKQDNIIY